MSSHSRRRSPSPIASSGRSRQLTRRPLQFDVLEDRTVPASAATFGDVPIAFEANVGQTDASVQFLSRGLDHTLFLTKQEAVLRLQGGNTDEALRMSLVGGNPNPDMQGLGQQSGQSNYLVGDSSQWRGGVERFDKVEYDDVYAGIDLVYYGNDQRRLEYDFIVTPGSDPAAIGIQFSGANGLSINEAGDLVLHMASGDLVQHAPISFQTIDGVRVPVSSSYEIRSDGTVGFQLGEYDASYSLVIDPILSFTAFFAGNDNFDFPSIAVDASGIYVAGTTSSATFPTTAGVLQPAASGNADVFAAKLNSTGTSLLWATYLGGSGDDFGRALAVDGSGAVYLTGNTISSNFPVATGALQTTKGSLNDAFIVKLDPSGGDLAYSTFLGGYGEDRGFGIAVNGNGEAYVAGQLGSIGLHTSGAFQSFRGGVSDAFVAKISSNGSTTQYLTYIGGAYTDLATAIAIDSAGNAYITGNTGSPTFPVTTGAVQTGQSNLSTDAFIVKVNPMGTGIAYGTFLGGGQSDYGLSIDVDSSGNAVVTGYTQSANFPTASAYQAAKSGNVDAFITKINSNATGYVFSTYFGGSGSDDQGRGVTVDASGNIYLVGYTNSANFPLGSSTIQSANAGSYDGFVVKLNSTGSSIGFGSYLGSAAADAAGAVAVDLSGNVFVAGISFGTFTPTSGTSQTFGSLGTYNTFVTKISESSSNQAPTVATPAAATTVVSNQSNLSVLGADDGGQASLTYTWTSTGPAAVSFSVNGTNAAKNTTATFTQAGSYTLTVTIRDVQGLTVTSSVAVTVSPPPNQAPTVATPAAATTVVSNQSNLSVLGADDGGQAALTYTWSSTGPAAVSFSVNGTNAAKNTTATFTQAGSYTLTVTIRDVQGLTVTSSVAVTVSPPPNQAPTVATPAAATTVVSNQSNLSVLGADDGGQAALTYTWSSTGPAAVSFSVNGTIAAKNTTATFTQAGSYTLTVTIRDAQGLTVTSSVGVTISPPPNQAPTIATPAAATTVVSNQSNLSVLGADDGGQAALIYTWSSTGPAAASFSVNGTNAAKNTTASFTQAGSYTLTVTIRDAQGLTVTSSVAVTVSPPPNQAPTVATPAAATTVVSNQSNLSVLGADDGGQAALTYTWSSTGPAAVSFSANGTNAAKNTAATFTQAGSYTLTVTIRDAQGLTVTSSVGVTVSPPPNQAPTVATPAAATTVVSNQSNLSVLGADDGGQAALTYTWSSTGPAAVSFSANGTNAAKNTTASFTQAGSYTLTVTIRDAQGLTVTSSVAVTVSPPPNQAPTVATPAAATTVVSNQSNLSVLGADDGGQAALTYTWSSTGPAAVSFSANGTNAAKNTAATFTQAGSYTLTVTIRDAQGLTVTSSVGVTISPPPNQAPTIATPAAATTVVSNQSNLSVLGADDGGQAALTYTWSSTGPAAVSFSANATNAAKNTTATFTQAGSYTLTVTIRDAQGLTVTSSIGVTVSPPPTTQPTADLFGRTSTGQIWVGASTGTSFVTSQWQTWSPAGTWVDTLSADFNGDGKLDIASRHLQTGQWWVSLSNGTTFTSTLWATWSSTITWIDVKVGDFNGDGKADIAGRAKSDGRWWVARSTGTTFTTTSWALWSTAISWAHVDVGDVNGDGKADIVGRYKTTGQWWVNLSTGTSFTVSLWATWAADRPTLTWVDVQIADFNGDGKADIAGRYLQTGQWWVTTSNGSVGGATTLWAKWSTAISWVDVKVGDFNGDGKADIMGRALAQGSWWLNASTGNTFTVGLWATWTAGVVKWVDVQVGDFDGDGKLDLAGRYQQTGQWWVSLSGGAIARNTTLWATWSPLISLDLRNGNYAR